MTTQKKKTRRKPSPISRVKRVAVSRQLYFHPDGRAAITCQTKLVMPLDTARKLNRIAALSHESTSQVVTALVEDYSPDPGLFLPPPHLAEPEVFTQDGKPEIWQRVHGGFMRRNELNKIRPILARNGITVWQLFRHWLRIVSAATVEREAQVAAKTITQDPEPNPLSYYADSKPDVAAD